MPTLLASPVSRVQSLFLNTLLRSVENRLAPSASLQHANAPTKRDEIDVVLDLT